MLTDDQIVLADLLLTPLTRANECYLATYYSSIGALIVQTYSADLDRIQTLTQLAPHTNAFDLISFLAEQRYIERAHHAGQFKITDLGWKVKNAGGHQKYQDHLKAIEQQELSAIMLDQHNREYEHERPVNRLIRFFKTPLGTFILGVLGGLLVAWCIAHFKILQPPTAH